MAEHLALEKVGRNRAAVHRDEGLLGAQTVRVHFARGELLSGPALTEDEAGGVCDGDALDEADVNFGRSAPERVVMIKCRACGKLNEEDSKFCQECGTAL